MYQNGFLLNAYLVMVWWMILLGNWSLVLCLVVKLCSLLGTLFSLSEHALLFFRLCKFACLKEVSIVLNYLESMFHVWNILFSKCSQLGESTTIFYTTFIKVDEQSYKDIFVRWCYTLFWSPLWSTNDMCIIHFHGPWRY